MLLISPGGVVADASDEHAKALLSAGWSPVETPKKQQARKRAPRKPKTTE